MTCIGGLLNTVTGSVILTADEVKEVEGHIDQLNAENARLRSCLSDDAENAKLREFAACMALMTDVADRNPNDMLTEYGTATTAYLLMAMSIDSLERKNRRLEDENAKLWELADRMLGSIRRFEMCSDSYSVSSVYEQWMRELRIEVDE